MSTEPETPMFAFDVTHGLKHFNEGQLQELDPKYLANFLKLANYLYALPDDYQDFDMTEFMTGEHEDFVDESIEPSQFFNYGSECMTAACAVGHSFHAGIEVEVGKFTDWWQVSQEAYGVSSRGEPVWEWCFSPEWAYVDNTAKSAAQRIYWMLDNNAVPINLFKYGVELGINSNGEEAFVRDVKCSVPEVFYNELQPNLARDAKYLP